LIAHGELPAKNFKSSGHWVLQIDLKEYLRANSTLYLEEILLFIPENISEITSGRVINSLFLFWVTEWFVSRLAQFIF
jgi:hypothetical protein